MEGITEEKTLPEVFQDAIISQDDDLMEEIAVLNSAVEALE